MVRDKGKSRVFLNAIAALPLPAAHGNVVINAVHSNHFDKVGKAERFVGELGWPSSATTQRLSSLLNGLVAREQGCDVKPEWANGATITVPHIGAADVEEARIELQPQHYNLRTSSELQLDVSEGDAQRRNRHPRQRC